jgi:hypothetical protein
VVPGNAKCHRCLKGKKGCKFPVEEGEGLENAEDVEEAPAVSKSPIASLKKLILSPLRSLRKRKETDLSPESQKEKAATSSIALCARRELLSPELLEFGLQVSMPPSSMMSSRSQDLFMPPPSMISSRSQVLRLRTICYIEPVLAFGTEQDIIVNSRCLSLQRSQRSDLSRVR